MKKRSKVNEIWKTINTSELQIGETNDIDTMFMCVCFESKAVWATLIQGPGQNFYLKGEGFSWENESSHSSLLFYHSELSPPAIVCSRPCLNA